MSRFRPSNLPTSFISSERSRPQARNEPPHVHRPVVDTIALAPHVSKTGHTEPDNLDLDAVFSRLWRAKGYLVGGAFAGALAMLLLSAVVQPEYRARTAIRLKDLNEQSPNLPPGFTQPAAQDESYLQNELKVIESDSLAKRVAVQLGIKSVTPRGGFFSQEEFAKIRSALGDRNQQLSPDELLIRKVREALTVRPSLKSQVLEIFFDSTDPATAARGANTVVSEYIAMNNEGRIQASRDDTAWLAGQISDLKKKLAQGNEELQAFARSNGLLYGANQSLLSEEKTRQFQEALSRARAERAAKKSNYEAALSAPPEAVPAGSDGSLRDYEAKLAATRSELIQLKALYTPSHYKVAEAEAREAQLELLVKAERQRIIERMRTDYNAADRLVESLERTYDAQRHELSQQTEAAFRYNVLKRDLDSTEMLYNSLSQKAKEAGITSGMRTVSVSVIDPAQPPTRPRSPNLLLNASIGFSSGLFLVGGIVLIRNRDSYLSTRVVDTGNLAVRELGTIPFARQITANRKPGILFKSENNTTRALERVAWYEQPSFLTEAFRSTVISIVFSPLLQKHKNVVLTVTSVHPQEGKTTTVCNVGIALAETHKSVLLIDADLRRPRIHEIFGHCNDRGLSTVLSGQEQVETLDLDTLIHETNVPGLSLLPSGPGAPSIPTLLYSSRFLAFLTRVRKDFDFVLIDTPPVSLFSDGRILGRHSDAVIVVIHAAKATRSEVNAMCANFVKDGSHVVGTIVNRASIRPRGYETYRPMPV